MTSIYNWSTIPIDNGTSDEDILWLEFQAPSTVNNSARQMMARDAEWRLDLSSIRPSTGAANTYEITVSSTPSAYVDGMMFAFLAHQSNTGASTLAVNNLGPKPLRVSSLVDAASGTILANQFILAAYDAANDQFIIPIGGSAAGSGGGISVVGIPQDDQLAVWVTSSSVEGTSNLTYNGTVLDVEGDVEATRFTEDVNAIGVATNPQTIDLTLGQVVTAEVTQPIEFQFANPAPSGQSTSFTFILTNGGSAAVTWPTSVRWDNGATPTLTPAGVDVLMFFTPDAGSNWYGFIGGNNMV